MYTNAFPGVIHTILANMMQYRITSLILSQTAPARDVFFFFLSFEIPFFFPLPRWLAVLASSCGLGLLRAAAPEIDGIFESKARAVDFPIDIGACGSIGAGVGAGVVAEVSADVGGAGAGIFAGIGRRVDEDVGFIAFNLGTK